jgi:hypothetical protein
LEITADEVENMLMAFVGTHATIEDLLKEMYFVITMVHSRLASQHRENYLKFK